MAERYRRQQPLIGRHGQAKLRDAAVLVIGAGGLGLPLLTALAGAGIGRIGLGDDGSVHESNLNRQFLYTPEDIGQPKLPLAIARLRAFQPQTTFVPLTGRVDADRADHWLTDYDLLVGAVDNLPTRLILNAAACRQQKIYIDGAIRGYCGQLIAVDPGHTACYTCFSGRLPDDGFPISDPPPVLAATAGVIGSLQANEVIRYLIGEASALGGDLLCYDGRHLTFDHVPLRREPHCPICKSSE